MYLTRDEYTAIKKKVIAHSTDNYIKYYVTLSVFLFLIAGLNFIFVFFKPDLRVVLLIVGSIICLLAITVLFFVIRKMNMPTVIIEYNPEGIFFPKQQYRFLRYSEIAEIVLDFESKSSENKGNGNILIRTKLEGSVDVRNVRNVNQAYAKISSLFEKFK